MDGVGAPHPLRRWRMDQRVKPAGWGHPARSMTIEQAAALGGWSPSLWSEWERGLKVPGRAYMVRLCGITGLEPNDFYLIDGVPFSEWRRRRHRVAGAG